MQRIKNAWSCRIGRGLAAAAVGTLVWAGASPGAPSHNIRFPKVGHTREAGPPHDPANTQGQWFKRRANMRLDARSHEFYDNVAGHGGSMIPGSGAVRGTFVGWRFDLMGNAIGYDIDATIENDLGGEIGIEGFTSSWHREFMAMPMRYIGPMYEVKLTIHWADDGVAGNWPGPGLGTNPYRGAEPNVFAVNHDQLAWYCWSADNPGDPGDGGVGDYRVPTWDFGAIPVGAAVTKRLRFGFYAPVPPMMLPPAPSPGEDLLIARTSDLKIGQYFVLDPIFAGIGDPGTPYPYGGGDEPVVPGGNHRFGNCSVFFNPRNDDCNTYRVIPSVPYNSGLILWQGFQNDLENPTCDHPGNPGAVGGAWWCYRTPPGPPRRYFVRSLTTQTVSTIVSIWQAGPGEWDTGPLTNKLVCQINPFYFTLQPDTIHFFMVSAEDAGPPGGFIGLAIDEVPDNDRCEDAEPVAVPSVTAGTLVGATAEAGPPPTCITTYAGTPAVWYTLVGNGNTLEVNTCSTAASFDTKLHIYCSDSLTPCGAPVSFTCVTGNDDGASPCGTVTPIRLSKVTFCSAAGQTYYILVSTFLASTPVAPFTLSVIDSGTACTTAVPCLTTALGACCNNTTQACTISAPTACTTGTFQGSGTSCTYNSPCTGVGACCSSTGATCTVALPANCTGTSTHLGVGTTCTPVSPCSLLLGACCNNTTQACTTTTPAGCSLTTSTFQGVGTVCGANLCPGTGACCATSGACTVTLATACTGTSTFQGAGMACLPTSPCPPSGACCIGLCCTVTLQAACAGTWGPGGSTCTPHPCGVPANDLCASAAVIPNASLPVTVNGASCGATSDGFNSSCVSSALSTVWWTYTPAYSAEYMLDTCGSTYDTVLSVWEGACGSETQLPGGCDDDEATCVPSTLASKIPALVLNAGTTYLVRVGSFGATTGPITLTINANGAVGACCAPGGSCTQTDAARCADTFNPGGTCTPNTCPQPPMDGACCCGSTCSLTAPGACVGPNQSFAGAGTVCNAPGNNTTPCCLADYNKAGGLGVQDIFDFLAGYFGSDACADINGGGISVQDIFDFLAAYFAGCP